MAVKSWNPNDVLTASDMDTWAIPRAVTTTGDIQSLSGASITDPTLVLPVDVNAIYDVSFFAVFDGPTAANGVFWSFTGPAAAAMSLYVPGIGIAGQNPELVFGGLATAVILAGVGTDVTSVANGTLVTAGTAGNLQFVWQPTASSGTATRRRARSRLMLRRIG